MEKVKTSLPYILGGLFVVIIYYIVTKKKNTEVDKSVILEKAREAKMAKSILKNQEDDSQSITI
jgi:hypothetical protein